jgi:hypothetical protein
VTPAEAAARLGLNPKRVRTWLRQERATPTGGRWLIDAATFAELEIALAPARRSADSSSAPLRSRDEIYVIDLCDEMFGVPASRQHQFEWLRGDPGNDGRPRSLPVDAYYEPLGLVVEYRETQHDRPVAFFDKPLRLTVSGVDRGTQRRIYDERRDNLTPGQGLRLWVITPADVSGDRRGRLSARDHDRDLEQLRRAWDRFAEEHAH